MRLHALAGALSAFLNDMTGLVRRNSESAQAVKPSVFGRRPYQHGLGDERVMVLWVRSQEIGAPEFPREPPFSVPRSEGDVRQCCQPAASREGGDAFVSVALIAADWLVAGL